MKFNWNQQLSGRKRNSILIINRLCTLVDGDSNICNLTESITNRNTCSCRSQEEENSTVTSLKFYFCKLESHETSSHICHYFFLRHTQIESGLTWVSAGESVGRLALKWKYSWVLRHRWSQMIQTNWTRAAARCAAAGLQRRSDMREGGSGILGLVGDCWNSGKEKQNYCKIESVGFDKRMFLIRGKNVLFL